MESIELVGYSIDQLEQQLVALEESHSQIVARQSVILQELDRRQVARGDGCRSMVDWVSSRLDLSPENAATLVRTSRRLADSPEVAKRLDCGEVSYDRAVELARWGQVAPGVDVISEHWRFDITGLRRQISHHRRVTRKDEQQTAREQHVVLQPDLERSSWRLWGELDGPAGAIVEQALQQRADELPAAPPGAPCSRSHRMALALTTLCQDYRGGTEPGGDHSQPLVTVVVTAADAAPSNGETGVTLTSGPRAGPQTLEAILCQGKVEVTAVTADGTPLAIGSSSSAIPPRLRRFVLARATGDAPPMGVPAGTASKSTTAPPDPTAATITPRTSPPNAGTTTKSSSTATDTTSTPPAHQDDSATRHPPGTRPNPP